jgi:starch synthase (maltosyl-transferring)
MSPAPAKRPPRIQIENVWPQLDCGRYPVKRTVGEPVEVWADVFRDGHEVLGAAVRYRRAGQSRWQEAPMRQYGSDRWTATFTPDACGRWSFAIGAWVDRFASWRWELQRKVDAGQEDLSSELAEGAALHEVDSLTAKEALASTETDRSEFVSSSSLEVEVDPVLARFGSWYELFPRSWGGFKGVAKVLPELADLGFDVLYLPPIHPIGHTNRKGRNNALTAAPADPGSPWAIGAEDGGHDAIAPELGSERDFRQLVARARRHGIEICLDFAIQCSPDHPWLREHPDWFSRRPDGTLKYAENPPKKYQDIYNVNFDSEDWQALWEALRDVVLHWVALGVTVFRVDNPHTKPVPFWEWLIREVRSAHPDVIFLSEAFTRPAMMSTLAKAGFNQSYTYFTWRNTKAELQQYLIDLTQSDLPQFFRPNFFVNTPDILHEYLQRGGRRAFEARLVLAATLAPSYGIYSGFEHCENVPAAEGSEEYLNSEKYEVRERRLDGPLLPLVRRVNEIRRQNPAFQRIDNIRFLETENDQLIAYAKQEGGNTVLVCVNIDPFSRSEGVCVVPVELGLPPAFQAAELLSEQAFSWRIGRNFLGLDAGRAHVLRVDR